jgi:hypothetical protein
MLRGGGDLIDAGDTRWKGPGHQAILVDRDTVFLVNHAYDAQANGASTLWIRPLYWSATAWPSIQASAGHVTTLAGFKRSYFPAGLRTVFELPDPLGRLKVQP